MPASPSSHELPQKSYHLWFLRNLCILFWACATNLDRKITAFGIVVLAPK